jgi:hypothetical protein
MRARTEPCTSWGAPVWLRVPMNVRVRSPVAVLRARRQLLLLLRVAVVVRYSPVRRSRVLWPAVSVAIAISVAVVRLVRLRPLPVGRRRPADAASAEGFVGGAHGAEVGIPADELGASVGGRGRRLRGSGGVPAAGARVASALQGERSLDAKRDWRGDETRGGESGGRRTPYEEEDMAAARRRKAEEARRITLAHGGAAAFESTGRRGGGGVPLVAARAATGSEACAASRTHARTSTYALGLR